MIGLCRIDLATDHSMHTVKPKKGKMVVRPQ
jgi:hypothetical protein